MLVPQLERKLKASSLPIYYPSNLTAGATIQKI